MTNCENGNHIISNATRNCVTCGKYIPRNDYDTFIRQGFAAGFLDDQIDFLADWLKISDGND